VSTAVKSVKFVGGPADGELRSLPDDQFDWIVAVLDDPEPHALWFREPVTYTNVRYVYRERTDETALGFVTFVPEEDRP